MKTPIVAIIAEFSFALPLMVGWTRFKSLNKTTKLFFFYTIIGAGEFLLSRLLVKFHLSNYGLSNYYRLVEVLTICFIFYHYEMETNKKKFIIVLALFFSLIWVVDLMFFTDITKIGSLMAMIVRIVLILISINTLHQILKNEKITNNNHPFFWFSSGIFLYNVTTLVILGISNELLKMGENYFNIVWHINWIMGITANIFYSKGLLCK